MNINSNSLSCSFVVLLCNKKHFTEKRENKIITHNKGKAFESEYAINKTPYFEEQFKFAAKNQIQHLHTGCTHVSALFSALTLKSFSINFVSFS